VTQYYAKDPNALGLSVSALVWRDREILLMRRSDNGHWGLPGGFVEVGESIADATRREVAEETGWSVELGRLIGVYSDPATNVVDYSTEGTDVDASRDVGTITDPSDSTDCGSEPVGDSGRGRVQIVNLCFQARAVEQGEATTPEETLEMGFFGADALPSPFVPIHRVRVEDGLAGNAEAAIR
jgi:ADP-ribose pyrophosphatase YjhB (NUDIX family)